MHVSKLIKEERPRDFDADVCGALGMTAEEWEQYRIDMRHTRDTYVAHRDLSKELKPIPLLDMAEKVAFFWDKWVREVMRPDQLNEAPLEDLARAAALHYGEEVEALAACIRADGFPSAE